MKGDGIFHRLLNLGKLVILEFQPVANIDAEREECNSNFGNYTAFVVFDESIITANVNNGTQHNDLLFGKPSPGIPGEGKC